MAGSAGGIKFVSESEKKMFTPVSRNISYLAPMYFENEKKGARFDKWAYGARLKCQA